MEKKDKKNKKNQEATVRIIKTTKDRITKHWPGEFYPQPVYIEIDPKRNTIRAAYDPAINELPMDIYNRLRIRLYLSNDDYTTARKINRLMVEISPLADRIVKGHRLEFNGMDIIGELSVDAEEAYNELMLLCINQDDLARMNKVECDELRWQSRL